MVDWGRDDKVPEPETTEEVDARTDQPLFGEPAPAVEQQVKEEFGLAASKGIPLGQARIQLDAQRQITPVLEGLKKSKIGFLEAAAQDIETKVPFSPAGAVESLKVLMATKRLKSEDYEFGLLDRMVSDLPPFLGGIPLAYAGIKSAFTDVASPEEQRASDVALVEDYIEKIMERQEKGYTWAGRTGQILSQMPAWMTEFALTGGLAKIGNKSAREFLKRGVDRSLKKAGLAAVKGAALRATVGMPHRTAQSVLERQIAANLSNDPENWATSVALGWSETFIETLSEAAGEIAVGGIKGAGLLAKMPFSQKFLSKIGTAWTKLKPENTWAKFAGNLLTKGGFNGIITEMGEERLATILHGLVGTQDFGAGKDAGPLARIMAGLEEDLDNIGAEAIAFGLLGGAQVGVAQAGRLAAEPAKAPEPAAEPISRPAEGAVEGKGVSEVAKSVLEPPGTALSGFAHGKETVAKTIPNITEHKGKQIDATILEGEGGKVRVILHSKGDTSFIDAGALLRLEDGRPVIENIANNETIKDAIPQLRKVIQSEYGRIKIDKTAPRAKAAPAKAPAVSVKEKVTEVQQAANEVASMLSTVREVAAEVEAEKTEERKRRVGKAAGTLESLLEERRPGEAIEASKIPLAGPLAEYAGRFESIRERMSQPTEDALYRSIAVDEDLQYFEKLNIKTALDNLIDGNYLAPYEAELIQRHFGGELGKMAQRRVPSSERWVRTIAEIMGIPTTMLTALSGDMSGIMRQARPLGQAYPKEFLESIVKYAKAWASEESDIKIAKEIKAMPFYNDAIKDKLEIPRYGEEVAEPTERGEEFVGGRLLEKIPIIGKPVIMAERGFVTGISYLRMAVYSKVRTAGFVENEKGELIDTIDKKDRLRLAGIINDASGRAHVKRTAAFKRWGAFLNVFFAPRFRLARMRMPFRLPVELGRFVKRYAKGERLNLPELRMTAVSFASMTATNLLMFQLVRMAYMAWGGDPDEFELEADLRSRNSGKIRIRDMKVDLWAGYLQDVQDYAQFVTGQAKSQAGELYDVDRKKVLLRAIRRRSSPLASLLVDYLTGETVTGRRFGAPPKGEEAELLNAMKIPAELQGASTEVWERLTPLVLQDAMAAWVVEGVPEAITMGLLSHVGVSVATYEKWATSEITKLRNDIAQENYGKKWDHLSPKQQERYSPIFEELETMARQERPLKARSRFITEEEEEQRERMFRAMPDSVRDELDKIGADAGGLGRRWGDYYLSDESLIKYEKYSTPAIARSLLKLFRSGPYRSARVDSERRDLVTKTLNEAKEKARERLKKEIAKGRI